MVELALTRVRVLIVDRCPYDGIATVVVSSFVRSRTCGDGATTASVTHLGCLMRVLLVTVLWQRRIENWLTGLDIGATPLAITDARTNFHHAILVFRFALHNAYHLLSCLCRCCFFVLHVIVETRTHCDCDCDYRGGLGTRTPWVFHHVPLSRRTLSPDQDNPPRKTEGSNPTLESATRFQVETLHQ